MRDALSLLDQAIAHGAGRVDEASVQAMLGAVDRQYLFGLLEALLARDGPALLAVADQMHARALSLETALQELATLLHRVALMQMVPEALSADEPDLERIRALAARFAAEDLQLFYQIAIQSRPQRPARRQRAAVAVASPGLPARCPPSLRQRPRRRRKVSPHPTGAR
jgi:DNA polymerase-3 subunit gamma/tau